MWDSQCWHAGPSSGWNKLEWNPILQHLFESFIEWIPWGLKDVKKLNGNVNERYDSGSKVEMVEVVGPRICLAHFWELRANYSFQRGRSRAGRARISRARRKLESATTIELVMWLCPCKLRRCLEAGYWLNTEFKHAQAAPSPTNQSQCEPERFLHLFPLSSGNLRQKSSRRWNRAWICIHWHDISKSSHALVTLSHDTLHWIDVIVMWQRGYKCKCFQTTSRYSCNSMNFCQGSSESPSGAS